MKKWKVPVIWEMGGFVEVEAPTLEAALKTVKTDPHIDLPEGEYVDSSFGVGMDGDVDLIRKLYNDHQKDEYDVCKGIENVVYDWLSHQKDPYDLDITAPDYIRIMNLVEGLCEVEFPELAESIFGDKDEDFIFSHRNNPGWYNLFYYNPDSSAGGQIVQCPFNKLNASEMTVNDQYIDVLADHTQYLSDVDSMHFFDTLFDLIHLKRNGFFLGSDVKEVCLEIIDEGKTVDGLIQDASAVSEKQDRSAADRGREQEFPVEI